MESLVLKVGPWEGPRPGLVPGQARLTILTPAGMHFGQAPFEILFTDPMSARACAMAARLMRALIAKATSQEA